MTIKTETIQISTRGHSEIIDITDLVRDKIRENGIREGQVLIFVPGSTAGVTTVEYEHGLLKDLPEAFEKIAPTGRTYHHDAAWGDGNGYAHVRASMLGPSLTVPVGDGELLLGTWQQIVLIDFDNRSRKRNLIIQTNGTE
jgi:secondary thiamine-phosphate synthase enzyme